MNNQKLLLSLFSLLSACMILIAQESPFEEKTHKSNTISQEHQVQGIKYQRQQATPQRDERQTEKRASRTLAPLQRQQLQSSLPSGLKITADEHTGMPLLIKGRKTSSLNNKSARLASAATWLQELAPVLCLENPSQELYVKEEALDELGFYHIKYQQQYEGIDVYGAELWVHVSAEADWKINGRHQATPYVNTSPTFSKAAAAQLVEEDLDAKGKLVNMSPEQRAMYNDYEGPYGELVIYPSKESFGDFKLVWKLTARPNFLERFEYFVDAHTGEIYHSYNHTCAIGDETATATDLNGDSRTIHTYLYQNNYYLYDASRSMYSGPANGLPMAGDGGIETLDFQNNSVNNPQFADISTSNNVWNNPNAVSAHYHAGVCYEYFRQTHNRSSINGQGGDILSFINVAEQGGGSMDNAFWNGQYMFYGSGGQAFSPLAGALDVSGHEMSHGVIQNTANLEYQGESGAINESMADVFGVLIDWGDWKLGEDIVKLNVFPSGALRDMQNPHNGGNQFGDIGWQPEHVDEQYLGSQDNGGVHFNSGIPNKAFYLIASQIGKSKSERIYYRALTQYLTKSSKFVDLRIAVVQAAEDISDVNANDVDVVRNAFAAVGIGEGAAGNYQEDLEENEGDEFVLFNDTNENDPNTMYLTDPGVSGFIAISQTAPNRKPSVTDDGTMIFFVGTDNNIRVVDLSSGSPNESVLTEDGFWDNCAVSKNGELLAAISTQIDTSIYVFDLSANNFQKFTLYNPTTATGGVTTAGVLYADVLEWDYDGEHLIYDSFNRVSSVTGEDLEYWDMGIIEVWNNSGNTYGNGTIEKVFSNLPEGVSVGNPTFAKVSPYIFGFDYFDFANNEVALLGANFETGDVGTIVEQSNLAYASYSGDDTKAVYTGSAADGSEEVRIINLNGDKISGSGSSASLIEFARWPIWFVQGERVLLSLEENQLSTNMSAYPNPVSDILNLEVKFEGRASIQVFNLAGQLVLEKQVSDSLGAQIDFTGLSSGQYFVELSTKNEKFVTRVIRD